MIIQREKDFANDIFGPIFVRLMVEKLFTSWSTWFLLLDMMNHGLKLRPMEQRDK
jgi:hypothetical protein